MNLRKAFAIAWDSSGVVPSAVIWRSCVRSTGVNVSRWSSSSRSSPNGSCSATTAALFGFAASVA